MSWTSALTWPPFGRGKVKPLPKASAKPSAKTAEPDNRVALAKIETKKIAVPVGKRPNAGTHVPKAESPRAGTTAPARSRGKTVAELDAELSQLPEDDYATLREETPLPAWAQETAPKPADKPKKKVAADTGTGRLQPGDERFLAGLKQAQVNEGTPRALWALYLLAIIVVCAGVWAGFAQVDIITRTNGKVVPEGREQVISSLEGGILRAMHVREGDLVEPGQDLMQLDPTRFAAQQNEGQAKRIALMGAIARLSAEAFGRALVFPPEVRVEAAVVNAETEAYQARRRSLDEAVAVSRRSMVLLDTELETASRMANQGLMSEVEVMRLRRQKNDMQLQVQERLNRFRQEAAGDLVKVRTELAQIEEQQVVKEDALKRTTLQSPVRGIIKNVNIGTIGGVVGAGATIMEILPLGERVLVEARIKPSDIGFVRVGLPAEVKLSAYDYTTYGGLKGTIEYISPDAMVDDKPGSGESAGSYYRARVRTETPHLMSRDNKPLPVLPGMTASVEIRTGDRSVLDFLLKPMLKTREAFTEH